MLKCIKPKSIRLEASSICQLGCPVCVKYTRSTENFRKTIGYGFLKLEDFQKIIGENPWIKQVELSNWGEIFLNPDLLETIKFAHRRNVLLSAFNGANLNNVNEEVLEGLVRYKFQELTCSIDGASNNTYKLYRVNGNFDSVIDNIKKINSFKKKYRSKYPLLIWQFIVFGHNEHEIPIAKKLAKDLGMRFRPGISWEGDFSPIKDQKFIKKETGLRMISYENYRQQYDYYYMRTICRNLWDLPQINWDGKNLGCCDNFWGDFGGNAFTDGLLETINSEKMKYAREMLLGRKDDRNDIPCSSCSVYMIMKINKKFLKWGPAHPVFRMLRFWYRLLKLNKFRELLLDKRLTSMGG